VNEPTLQNDPNIKLPAAVRAAAARSNEIIKALKEGQEPVTPESNPEQPPSEAQFQQDATPEAPAEAVTEPAKEPAKSRTKEASKDVDEESSWERRYNSMKGRFDRSQEQIKDLSAQIQNLQGVISTMQMQAPSQPLPEMQFEKLITEDEARDYGEDFLKVVGKKAKEELSPLMKAYEAKIAELEQKVQGVNNVVAQDSHAKLMESLDAKLPDWRDLNTNEEFLSWLRLPDPFSGAIRHDMLKAAYAAGNASRVLAFFNGFLAEEAAVAPVKGDSDDVPTERVAKVPLAKLAAPGRAKSAAGESAPAEKPTITRAQIAQFYSDVSAGKYRGKDVEKSRLEAMIFDAQREGRIR
jgi:DNA-binding SARP family transcriptional activator